MDVTKNRSQHQIKNGDIILTYIGMYLWTLMLRLWTIQRLQNSVFQEPIRVLKAMYQ